MKMLKIVETAAAPTAIIDNKIRWAVVRKGGDDFLKKCKISELEKLVIRAKKRYYEGNPVMDDYAYDNMEDILRLRKPNSKALIVGTDSHTLNKVTLPYPLFSLDKVKTEKALSAFMKRNATAKQWVEADKLDGISFELIEDNGTLKMYTRGDGIQGKDITPFIPHLRGLPKRIPAGFAGRGELIMSDAKFKSYMKDFANPRNMVAGITNRLDIHKSLKDIDAVFYEVLSSKKPLSKQLEWLVAKGFQTVTHRVIRKLDFNSLVDDLANRKKKSKYAIDGLVITCDTVVSRATSGNPTYAIAFKQNLASDMKEVVVTSVIWQISRTGRFIPVVNIEPTHMAGVTVTRVTAHNALYIKDNKIGPGAVLKVIRSGEVIPYINEVVKPAKKAQLPDTKVYDYHWEGVHLVNDSVAEETEIKQMEYFFAMLGVDGFKYGSVAKMMAQGWDLPSIVNDSTEEDFTEVLGVNGKKVYRSIEDKLWKPDLYLYMAASGCFNGIAESRLSQIVQEFPDVMKRTPKKAELLELPGWASTLATSFLNGLKSFRTFAKGLNIEWTVQKPVVGKLSGMVIVFTGFRDKSLENAITSKGGKIGSGITKSTTVVVSKPGNSSSKLTKASDLGIPIMMPDEFKKKYLK